MDATTTVVVVAVLVVLVVAALVAVPMLRRRRLRDRFGPEYERAVDDHGSRAVAEQELRAREKRYAELELRELTPEDRERYTTQWAQAQALFVDEPRRAVRDADQLVTALIADRGYPTDGFDQQVADLSVEHAATLDRYRAAHDTRMRLDGREDGLDHVDGHPNGRADGLDGRPDGAEAVDGTGLRVDRAGRLDAPGEVATEDLREAMVHYRSLFEELLGEPTTGHSAADHAADTAGSGDREARRGADEAVQR